MLLPGGPRQVFTLSLGPFGFPHQWRAYWIFTFSPEKLVAPVYMRGWFNAKIMMLNDKRMLKAVRKRPLPVDSGQLLRTFSLRNSWSIEPSR